MGWKEGVMEGWLLLGLVVGSCVGGNGVGVVWLFIALSGGFLYIYISGFTRDISFFGRKWTPCCYCSCVVQFVNSE